MSRFWTLSGWQPNACVRSAPETRVTRTPPVSRPVSRVFIEGCEVVVTMDDAGTEIPGGSILIEDGVITWVGRDTTPGSGAAERINGRGTVAIPGLIHCHTHLYHTLTRVRVWYRRSEEHTSELQA